MRQNRGQTRVVTIAAATAISLAAGFVYWRSFDAPPPSGQPYELVAAWPRLPDGEALGQVAGVAVEPGGDVVVFHRAERIWEGEDVGTDPINSPTLLRLDEATGEVLEAWGQDDFVLPHGLTIDAQGNQWLTDVGLHQVFKFDAQHNLLLALGEPGVAGTDEARFDQPTDVAVAPDGTFYVADGYGNSRILKFSAEGRLLGMWGQAGSGPGEFDVPHGIALDQAGRVYVADRGNARLQIFDGEGAYLTEWRGPQIGRPWAVRVGADGSVYVVDGGDQPDFLPDRARINKFDANGELLASFGGFGKAPGEFTWPHAIALGADGALYIGEVSTGMRAQKFAPLETNPR